MRLAGTHHADAPRGPERRASQLVLTIDSLPDGEQQIALADVWEEITAFAASIPTLPLADVIARLEAYKEQIAAILGVAPLAAPSPEPSGSGPGTTATPDATPEATDSRPSSSPTVTASPAATPAGTTGSTSQLTTSPEPTPTPSASP